MSVHMRGFTIQKLYQAGKVSEKEIYGNYDGKKAQFVAVNDGKMEKGSLTNRDIATLLSLRASPHSLVERLEHDLGRGQHRRRRTRRHRRRRHKKNIHVNIINIVDSIIKKKHIEDGNIKPEGAAKLSS